jgi:hypothetical protein
MRDVRAADPPWRALADCDLKGFESMKVAYSRFGSVDKLQERGSYSRIVFVGLNPIPLFPLWVVLDSFTEVEKMMKGLICVAAVIALCLAFALNSLPMSSASAQEFYSESAPVVFDSGNSSLRCSNGSCGSSVATTPVRMVIQAPVRIIRGTVQAASVPVRMVQNTVRTVGSTVGAVVNRDSRAFEHAQQEALIQAQYGKEFHALGCAPGTNRCGVGSSSSVNEPSHCTFRRAELVARAYAVGNDGKVYWSAHYRR